MNKWQIIKKYQLDKNQAETSKTRFNFGEKEVTNGIVELKICELNKDDTRKVYYIFYFDKDGKEIGDTYHDTLEEAFEQAKFTYGIKPDDWETISEEY